MLYTSSWSRFKFTTWVVIGTDSIGSCTSRHSKHHKITKQTTINAVISILPVASFYSHIYTAFGLILLSYLYCLWPHSTVISILPVASFYLLLIFISLYIDFSSKSKILQNMHGIQTVYKNSENQLDVITRIWYLFS